MGRTNRLMWQMAPKQREPTAGAPGKTGAFVRSPPMSDAEPKVTVRQATSTPGPFFRQWSRFSPHLN
jgi:hypothetical protein